jgi:hypothetical protein
VVLICFLWNFAPGAATPLQFYLTNELHASDAVYSYYNGIFVASFIPTFLLYGYLCQKIALNKLLWWGTVIAVPQVIPLAFVHSAKLALVLAVPIGLLGGIATAAYFDLAMRSCPPGLQGTLMMLVDGVFMLSARGGDLLGSKIYNISPTNGFLYCVIATTSRVCADPALDSAGAEGIDRYGRRRTEPESRDRSAGRDRGNRAGLGPGKYSSDRAAADPETTPESSNRQSTFRFGWFIKRCLPSW